MDRLLVLTLALEESILNGDWQGATGLLEERDLALASLSGSEHPPRIVDQILAAEARCVALLAGQRKDLASSWQEGRLGRQWAAMSADPQCGSFYE